MPESWSLTLSEAVGSRARLAPFLVAARLRMHRHRVRARRQSRAAMETAMAMARASGMEGLEGRGGGWRAALTCGV